MQFPSLPMLALPASPWSQPAQWLCWQQEFWLSSPVPWGLAGVPCPLAFLLPPQHPALTPCFSCLCLVGPGEKERMSQHPPFQLSHTPLWRAQAASALPGASKGSCGSPALLAALPKYLPCSSALCMRTHFPKVQESPAGLPSTKMFGLFVGLGFFFCYSFFFFFHSCMLWFQ